MSGPGTTLNERKSPVSTKLGYAFAAAACGFGQILPSFITYYMTESLVIPILVASTMILVVKILDAFTDIICGFIIDKSKNKRGKARPFFLYGSIPYGVCMVLIFSVPQSLSTTAKVAMVAIFYALTISIFGTMVNVARYAILPRMSKHPSDRATFSVIGDGMLCIMSGILFTVTLPLVQGAGWQKAFLIFAIIGIICLLIGYALCKELPREELDGIKNDAEAKKVSNKALLKSLFTNKYALFILIYVLIQGVVGGLCQLGGTYYFTYVANNVAGFSICMGLSLPLGIVGMFISRFVMARTSRLFGYGCICGAIMMLLVFLFGGPNNAGFTIVGVAIAMVFAMTVPMVTFGQMSSMAVEYGEWKSGTRSDGMTTSVVNIGTKIGSAAGSTLIGALMAAGGFVEGGGAQTEGAIAAIKNAYLLGPVIVFAIGAVFFFVTWRLHKQMPKIQADLAQRHAS